MYQLCITNRLVAGEGVPETPALDTLQDWVVRSYRPVAPRRLGDRLRPPAGI